MFLRKYAAYLGCCRQDFHSGDQKKISRNSTRFGVRVAYMNGTCKAQFLVMPQGWDLVVPWGLGGRPKTTCPLELNQSWCVSYLHEWHMQRGQKF